MPFENMNKADYTYPWIWSFTITGDEEDVDLKEELGNYPRSLVAGADGDLVFRLLNDAADRTLAVSKGFVMVGIIKQIGGDTTCEPTVFG